jgi:phosphoglycolate phosphatase-like HAD superfamily hydrolase
VAGVAQTVLLRSSWKANAFGADILVQSFNRQIKNLLFDWDGTLVDSAHLGLLAFEKTFSELGVPFTHAVYEANYSPNWYSTYEALGLPRSFGNSLMSYGFNTTANSQRR